MAKSKGGAGRQQGRKLDWGEETSSRITVPFELTETEQKRSLVATWSVLQQSGRNFTDLVASIERYGIDSVLHPRHKSQPYRLYSTAVAASFGVTSASDAEAGGYDEVNLIDLLIKSPDRTILLEVTGNSMLDSGIYPGSILIVEMPNTTNKAWLDVKDRDTVIALVDEVDLTVKQYRKTRKGEFLAPRNRSQKKYQPLVINNSEDEQGEGYKVTILGIVRSVTQFL